MANTFCRVPAEFANRLVGGLFCGKSVSREHGLRMVQTNGCGNYRPLGYVKDAESRKIFIWFHETITDLQADLFVAGSVSLECHEICK